MNIREATPADVRSIAEIHVATWKSTYAGIVPKGYLDRLKVEDREAMWTRILQEKKPGTHLLLAESEGRVVGFSNGGPSRDSVYPAEIYAIYLLQQKQGQGIGRALFQASLERVRKDVGGAVMLWVLEENPTLAFYQKAGGVIREEKMDSIGGKDLRELLLVWD